MAAIITEKFRQHNAEQFFESFSETAASNYYLFIGKHSPFTPTTSGGSDIAPPIPNDDITIENYKWDSMLAAKRIGSTDVAYVVPRRNYTNGAIYDMYEHDISTSNPAQSGATSLYEGTFYFMTPEFKVYKVLDNNGGAPIAAGATGPVTTSSDPFFEGGYYLQYMYTLTTSQVQKFVTSDFIPVYTDGTVSSDAATNSLDTAPYHGAPIKVVRVTPGSGYTDGEYFAPIHGDGTGGIVRIRVSGNEIQPFGEQATETQIEQPGSGYTFATIDLTDVYTTNTLTTPTSMGGNADGEISCVITSRVGHGFDAVSELGAHFVMMNARLEQTETDDFSIANDFREVGIVVDPFLAGTTTSATVTQARMTYAVKIDTHSGSFEIDEKITQNVTGAVGRVVEWDEANKILYYLQERFPNYGVDTDGNQIAFTGANTITGGTSGASASPDITDVSLEVLGNGGSIQWANGYALPELESDSGKIIYIENRRPISRASDQTEDIKIVVEF